jgi:hypothetical protein
MEMGTVYLSAALGIRRLDVRGVYHFGQWSTEVIFLG